MATDVNLDAIAFFDGLAAQERAAMAGAFTRKSFAPGEPIVWVGDQPLEFYVIETGRVEVCVPDEAGQELILAHLGPGEYFGEISLFDRGPRTTTVRAFDQTTLFAIAAADFRAMVAQHGSIAVHMLESLAVRQRASLEKLRGIRNVNEVIQEKLSGWQKAANFIAETAASRGFLLTHACAFGSWILANAVLGPRAWDPYPFLFLCFWASVEAIFLSLFILVSQATQSQKDRLRNESEYQVALKLQFEIMQLHQKLDEAMAEKTRAERSAGPPV